MFITGAASVQIKMFWTCFAHVHRILAPLPLGRQSLEDELRLPLKDMGTETKTLIRMVCIGPVEPAS